MSVFVLTLWRTLLFFVSDSPPPSFADSHVDVSDACRQGKYMVTFGIDYGHNPPTSSLHPSGNNVFKFLVDYSISVENETMQMQDPTDEDILTLYMH